MAIRDEMFEPGRDVHGLAAGVDESHALARRDDLADGDERRPGGPGEALAQAVERARIAGQQQLVVLAAAGGPRQSVRAKPSRQAANRFVLGPDVTRVPNRPQQLSVLCHPAALHSFSAATIDAALAMLPGAVGLASLLGSNPIAQALIRATATAAMKSLLNETTLTTRLANALKSRSITPAHIASTQRALERVLKAGKKHKHKETSPEPEEAPAAS